MKKFLVKKASNGEITNIWTSESNLDETHYEENFGKPERIVDDIEGTYDPADVIEKFTVTLKEPLIAYEKKLDSTEEVPFELEPGVYEHKVKLKAEYTIEIEDISFEYELNEVISKRKSEYPTMEEFMNAYFDGGEIAVQELQNKRLRIKAKYPKPVKE
jgi:hypothetical protein